MKRIRTAERVQFMSTWLSISSLSTVSTSYGVHVHICAEFHCHLHASCREKYLQKQSCLDPECLAMYKSVPIPSTAEFISLALASVHGSEKVGHAYRERQLLRARHHQSYTPRLFWGEDKGTNYANRLLFASPAVLLCRCGLCVPSQRTSVD